MQRYLEKEIIRDLKKKIVILTGPRQVGKTYLSKQIAEQFNQPQYMNYDNDADISIVDNSRWSMDADFLIFDELHKKKNWKAFLKGTYDKKSTGQSILVTGSSRMETFRQSGESLAGRYYHFRLHPLSVKELGDQLSPHEALKNLIALGGFPEPFLTGSEDEANRWRKQYYSDLIREDILEFSRINEIRTMRLLLELLRKRVGSPLSYRSLAEDLHVSPNTVRHYVDILETLYIVFLLRPHHKNISRSIQKEPKLYFYDSGYVIGDEGVKLENTVALCLLKHTHFLQDAKGKDITLSYIRTKEKKEIDFVLIEDEDVRELIEVKSSDKNLSRDLLYFKSRLRNVKAVQVVMNLRDQEYYREKDIHVVKAGEYLTHLKA